MYSVKTNENVLFTFAPVFSIPVFLNLYPLDSCRRPVLGQRVSPAFYYGYKFLVVFRHVIHIF